EIERAVALEEVEDMGDVPVRDRRREARLVEEHRAHALVRLEVREDRLDGHGFLESARAAQAPRPDRSHAPGRDRMNQLVALDSISRLEHAREHARGRDDPDACSGLVRGTHGRTPHSKTHATAGDVSADHQPAGRGPEMGRLATTPPMLTWI